MLRQDDKILQPKGNKIEIALPGDGSCTGNRAVPFNNRTR